MSDDNYGADEPPDSDPLAKCEPACNSDQVRGEIGVQN